MAEREIIDCDHKSAKVCMEYQKLYTKKAPMINEKSNSNEFWETNNNARPQESEKQ